MNKITYNKHHHECSIQTSLKMNDSVMNYENVDCKKKCSYLPKNQHLIKSSFIVSVQRYPLTEFDIVAEVGELFAVKLQLDKFRISLFTYCICYTYFTYLSRFFLHIRTSINTSST